MKTLATRISVWLLGSLACALAANAPDDLPDTPLFRCYFAGQKTISATTNGTTARAIAAMPATHRLLDLALHRLAATPARLWPDALPKDATNHIPLLHPLLSDLLTAESWTQCRGRAPHWEWTMAVRLSPEQTARWKTNLWQLLSRWDLGTPLAADPSQGGGWDIKNQKRSFYFQWAAAKDWIVLSAASRPGSRTAAGWLKQIGASGQPMPTPPEAWLDLEIDWPRLPHPPSIFGLASLPHTRWTIRGEGENLKTQGQMTFAEPLNITLDPWLIPTNLIYDPLVSFSAARGIRPLFSQIKGLAGLGLPDPPNQCCLWGQPAFYGQTLLAAPSAQPSNQVTALMQTLPPVLTNLLGDVPGQLFFLSNRSELIWTRLPIISPFAMPASSGSTSYFLAGIAPMLGKTNPPPPQLFTQLSLRTNLVYYGWEITEQRLLHHRHYFQLAAILADRKRISTNDLSVQWLQDIHKKLGNTITEITLSNPSQLALVRRSHLGLSGLECVLLARWIDSPGFPLTFELPKLQFVKPDKIPNKTPSKPAKP